uniref:Uncharacterized protein n=1 Tax=Anguilla anguilla TaxID=7936 RepID=A0A0E9SNH4_ANGAN
MFGIYWYSSIQQMEKTHTDIH